MVQCYFHSHPNLLLISIEALKYYSAIKIMIMTTKYQHRQVLIVQRKPRSHNSMRILASAE